MIKRLIAYRETSQLDLDHPSTTLLRRHILEKNGLLRKVYQEWYLLIIQELPRGSEPILELGTGPGFLKEMEKSLVTSEIQWIPGINLVLNGQFIPFADTSLRSIIMTNVLHHVPDVKLFFAEASRCLTSTGKIIMIEPWLTAWSRFIYVNLHYEPMDPEAETWEFPSDGPLSGANEALPWIIFRRDREEFEKNFPQLEITRIEPMMPLLYLVTGGYSSRFHMPGWTFAFWRLVEAMLKSWTPKMGMFAVIVLSKRS